MSLEYSREKYKSISEDILKSKNINSKKIKEICNELDLLGEKNVSNSIMDIKSSKGNKLNSIKNIFGVSSKLEIPNIQIRAYKYIDKSKLLLSSENNIEIATDKEFSLYGEIEVKIKNYLAIDDDIENNISDLFILEKYINKEYIQKSSKINTEIRDLTLHDEILNFTIRYEILFEANLPEKIYREYMYISFNGYSGKFYEFNIDCKSANNKTYDFKFENLDQLYDIFKNDVEKLNSGESTIEILDIFKDKEFVPYLIHINENQAASLYEYFNKNVYEILDVDMFFSILGYEKCEIKETEEVVIDEDISIDRTLVNSTEVDFNLGVFNKLFKIDGIDNELEFRIFNDKDEMIEVVKASDAMPKVLNKFLSKIFKDKMEKYNSSILIKDKKTFKNIFERYIKKEDINNNYKVYVYSKNDDKELNLYKLKIKMYD